MARSKNNVAPQVKGVDNLIGFFNLATPGEIEEGAYWYEAARISAKGLSLEYGIGFDEAAAVIAALSPRMQWSRNLVMAKEVIDCWHRGLKQEAIEGAFKANIVKAYRILNGELPLDVLGGNKVRSFFKNIVGSENDVTVDTWAYRAWVADIRITPAKMPGDLYARIVDDYRQAALTMGCTPAQFQAIVWVVVRNLSRNHK